MKIVVSGASQCGKSTYIKKLDENSLNVQVHGRTVAMDVAYVKVGAFHISLFGTPGLLRFTVMRNIIANGADGIIFMFDASNPESDKDALSIMNDLRKSKAPILYLANKQDLKGARTPEEVKSQNNLPKDIIIYPASAKTGLNVKKSLTFLVNEVYKRYEKLLLLLRNYEDNIRGLAEKLKKNKAQMRDFLFALEIRKFIDIDRMNKTYKVRQGLNKII